MSYRTKKVVKKLEDAVDARKIENIISSLSSTNPATPEGNISISRETKKSLVEHLELMKSMLLKLENSKITISKLQQLVGFYTEDMVKKEV